MRRRTFIALIGGMATAFAWPHPARAANGGKRIAIFMGYGAEDAYTQSRVDLFLRGLEALGWKRGGNLKIDVRYGGGSVDQLPRMVKELIDLQPDLILSNTTAVTVECARQTKTIPIVFVVVSDPVGSGLIESLARPGGNVTGFVNIEGSVGGKWLELLRELAPSLQRVGILFNPETAPYFSFYMQSIETAATSLGVEAVKMPVRSSRDIEDAMEAIAHHPGSGFIGITDSFLTVNRDYINELALRYKIPAMFGWSDPKGLASYAPDSLVLFRQAAPYADRILHGAKPGELPVQLPTKFSFTLNLKVAKMLGLEVPDSLLVFADQVIE